MSRVEPRRYRADLDIGISSYAIFFRRALQWVEYCDRDMKNAVSVLLWLAVAALGAFAYLTLALRRAEPVNSAFIPTAALCTYAISYRFYSQWIAARVLALNDARATPSRVHDDGKDFVPTNKWIVFGHHFAAISGPGPLLGPVLASQFGYLPGA